MILQGSSYWPFCVMSEERSWPLMVVARVVPSSDGAGVVMRNTPSGHQEMDPSWNLRPRYGNNSLLLIGWNRSPTTPGRYSSPGTVKVMVLRTARVESQ